MARFYALAVQPKRFAEVALGCSWGRIGTHGLQKMQVFNDEK